VDEVGKFCGPTVFLLFVVVGALVLGSAMGASGKDEMIRLDNQSDVSRTGEEMMDTRTMQVQVTDLLRTDSVAKSVYGTWRTCCLIPQRAEMPNTCMKLTCVFMWETYSDMQQGHH